MMEERQTQMSTGVNERCTLVDAARQMRKLDVDAISVTGQNGRVLGTLTAMDLLRCLGDGGDPAITRAGEIVDSGEQLRTSLAKSSRGEAK